MVIVEVMFFVVDSNLMLSRRLEDAEGVKEGLEGAVKSWAGWLDSNEVLLKS